jgi:hypothetical protein
LANFAWFAQIRNMSRGYFSGKGIFSWFSPPFKMLSKN